MRADAAGWGEFKAHLNELLDATPDDRAERLSELRETAPRLAAELEEWLSLEPEAESLFGPSETRPPEAVRLLAKGESVGRYRILRALGFGGDGLVYEAEQDDPARKVALKLLRTGLDEPLVLRRFLEEANLLARLHHPHIATVFEAGMHTDGIGPRPWFTMELVEDGVPLTEYVRSRALDLRTRLELFLEACDAIDHGHRHGIVHRDVKPANLLVDARGTLKVIDFGVAKLLGSSPAEGRLTQSGDLVGTLRFMSPEQCAGRPDEVGLPSDVFSLGVVLYELVCGVSPYPRRGLSIGELVERIRESSPQRPSRAAPIDADLEAIVLHALAKAPAERYGSAGALALDLRRFLAGSPVTARPPSLAHHARLFLRRHRRLAAGALAVTLLGLLGAGHAYREVGRVEAIERARAEEVTGFLASILELSMPSGASRGDLTMREVLDHTAERMESELAEAPAARASIHMTIGGAYRELGLFERAESHQRAGLALMRRVPGHTPADIVEGIHGLAQVLVEREQGGEAAELLREARALEDEHAEIPRVYVGITCNRLAEALLAEGLLGAAEESAAEAIATYESLLGPQHRAVAAALRTAAEVDSRAGRHALAIQRGRRALRILESHFAPDSVDLARVQLRLAGWLLAAGAAGPEEEEAFRREARALLDLAGPTLTEALPPEHPRLVRLRACQAAAAD